MNPAEADITAYRGGGPLIDVTDFEDYDYSAATFTMEVRRQADDPLSALVTLTNAAANAEGISCAYVAGNPGVSTVTIRINETTLEGMPKSSPPGADVEFVYALDIAGGGHPKQRRMRGKFILKAGENA